MRLRRLKHSESHSSETSFRLPLVAPYFKRLSLWALRIVLVPTCLCHCNENGDARTKVIGNEALQELVGI